MQRLLQISSTKPTRKGRKVIDLIEYAKKNGVAIAIDPYGEYVFVTVSPAVENGDLYIGY